MASAAVFVYLEKCFSKENLKVPIDLETIEIGPDAVRRDSRPSSVIRLQHANCICHLDSLLIQ